MKKKCLHFLLVAVKVVKCEWYVILKLLLKQCKLYKTKYYMNLTNYRYITNPNKLTSVF